MERFLTLFFLTIIVLSASIFALRTFSAVVQTNNAITSSPPLSHVNISVIPTLVSFIPEKLIIEKLSVTAAVESVGMDQQGRMDVPKDPDNVAWYNLGYTPGQIGSAVIAGHFDRADGSPAVFYDLTQLVKGDMIHVSRGNKTLTFEVMGTQTFDAQNFPMKQVFDTRDGVYLNLITCDGVFDKSKKSYTKRYVVFSKLKMN